MLAGKKPFNTNPTTRNMISKLPGWMKMTNPESVGGRFLNSIVGSECELIYDNLEIYSNSTNIVDSATDTINKLWQVQLEYPFASGIINPTDDEGNVLPFSIYAVDDDIDFFGNPATRLVLEGDPIIPSGLGDYVITGVEWLHGFPSGTMTVQTSADPVDPSSTLYYRTYGIDNSLDDFPFSGDAFGLATLGLGENAGYDILTPESEWSLRRKYPMSIWHTASGTEELSPPSGVSAIYTNYIDIETGEKTYFYKGFNNPYGSGVYNQADVQLTYEPISGTVKVFDIQNLTSSGTPYEIPSSGIQIYQYASGMSDGVWIYKGYENPIPITKTPAELIDNIKKAGGGTFTAIVPSSVGSVSWRMLPSGGYLDNEIFPYSGTFNWVEGSGGLGKTIRFSGGFSKYQAEYDYRLYNNITQLSAEPRDGINTVSKDGGSLFFIDGSTNYREYMPEISESSDTAFRLPVDVVRPGSDVSIKFEFAARHYLLWNDAKNTDKTVQLLQHNMGYTDEFGAY